MTTVATKRTVAHKGLSMGPVPSDRIGAQLMGQAVSTGRGGKKQLTLRNQSNISGKGSTFIAGQSYGQEIAGKAGGAQNTANRHLE